MYMNVACFLLCYIGLFAMFQAVRTIMDWACEIGPIVLSLISVVVACHIDSCLRSLRNHMMVKWALPTSPIRLYFHFVCLLLPYQCVHELSCIHICIYICIYICAYICVCIYTSLSLYIYIYTKNQHVWLPH